jgi:hypothetical protein
MRVPFVLIPIALTLAALPAAAQEAPRVIFCSGQCFTVDANGVRTAAPKGTQLREGQRIETGPGGYVQVKIGPDGAVGLSERGRARFERNVVILEDGRLRILGGEAFGRPAAAAPIELRTRDGSFVLRSADIEAKKTSGADATSNLTVMKVNAGDARMRSAQGDIVVPKEGVQGFSAGTILTGRQIPLSEIATPTPSVSTAVSTTSPVAIRPSTTLIPLAPVVSAPLRDPVLVPLTGTISPITTIAPAPTTTVVTSGDRLLVQPLISPTTGTTTTLTDLVKTTTTVSSTTSTTTLTTQPTTTTYVLQPVTTTSKTISPTLLLIR